MKLEFEKYLDSQNFTDESLSLINEGIVCYKVGAYRASFLLSYYFFLKVLKERLERAKYNKPSGIEEGDWSNILNKINDDSIWDEEVYKSTQRGRNGSSTIFLISNDIKEDMQYWRRKRNDCAHAKDNLISYPHVESFWLFLQSNLNKFMVNGGKEALLEKCEKHFNPIYTRPGEDYKPLIDAIPNVVSNSDEIPELLRDINQIIEDKEKYSYLKETQISYSFWKDISCSTNAKLNKGFIEFITFNKEIFVQFIGVYPEKLAMCLEKKELIREFWKKELFSTDFRRNNSFWKLAIYLLENKIIDQSAIEDFVRKLANLKSTRSLNAEQIAKLRTYGFFRVIKEYLFEGTLFTTVNTGYPNANENVGKIIFYLNNEELDITVVRSLNALCNGMTYGGFYDQFKEYIETHPEFVEKFLMISEENNITPSEIFNVETETV